MFKVYNLAIKYQLLWLLASSSILYSVGLLRASFLILTMVFDVGDITFAIGYNFFFLKIRSDNLNIYKYQFSYSLIV